MRWIHPGTFPSPLPSFIKIINEIIKKIVDVFVSEDYKHKLVGGASSGSAVRQKQQQGGAATEVVRIEQRLHKCHTECGRLGSVMAGSKSTLFHT